MKRSRQEVNKGVLNEAKEQERAEPKPVPKPEPMPVPKPVPKPVVEPIPVSRRRPAAPAGQGWQLKGLMLFMLVLLVLLGWVLWRKGGVEHQGSAETPSVPENELERVVENRAGDRKEVMINQVAFAFRFCPPGSFNMGSPAEEANRSSDERPHEVRLTSGV